MYVCNVLKDAAAYSQAQVGERNKTSIRLAYLHLVLLGNGYI